MGKQVRRNGQVSSQVIVIPVGVILLLYQQTALICVLGTGITFKMERQRSLVSFPDSLLAWWHFDFSKGLLSLSSGRSNVTCTSASAFRGYSVLLNHSLQCLIKAH